MSRDVMLSAAMELDRMAAETPELHWIAPLIFIKEQILSLAGMNLIPEEALFSQLERADRALRSGQPLPPDAPRRMLFELFDAACLSPGDGDSEALRMRCALGAEALRAARRARSAFQKAWRRCPEPVRREEEVAFDSELAALETAFDRLLRLREEVLHAQALRARLKQARYTQAALLSLPEPRIPAEPAAIPGCEEI